MSPSCRLSSCGTVTPTLTCEALKNLDDEWLSKIAFTCVYLDLEAIIKHHGPIRNALLRLSGPIARLCRRAVGFRAIVSHKPALDSLFALEVEVMLSILSASVFVRSMGFIPSCRELPPSR